MIFSYFLFLNQRYQTSNLQDTNDTIAFSNHSANLIKDWQSKEEDGVWK